HDLAGKTGTTQNQVDAWFAGYHPDIVAISWLGFDQPRSLHEWGADAALPLWIQFMSTALAGKPEQNIRPPADIVSMRIDPITGELALPNQQNAISEYFMLPYTPKAAPTQDLAAPLDQDTLVNTIDEALPSPME
ncbi:MAG: membrane carboxypeptidase/penicillin-binding protein, partial [uncultured bacterium]